MARPYCRVLLVDDFEPVRNLICSTLRDNPHLQVVSQASDGLEAVQKAEEIQPELILLDVSLPKLHGLEAARRILRVSPSSKIVFVSQESTKEVVEEGLLIGAKGYIAKADVGHELLPGINAVLRGENFLSTHIVDHHRRIAGHSKSTAAHAVSFYPDNSSLLDGLSRCIKDALDTGKLAVAVVTEPQRSSLPRSLKTYGCEVDREMEQGRLVVVSVAEAQAMFSLNDKPDFASFAEAVRNFIDTIAERAKSKEPKVVCCGECAATLLAEGRVEAALHLEQLLNEVCKSNPDISIHCAYLSNLFDSEKTGYLLERICAQHSAVLGR